MNKLKCCYIDIKTKKKCNKNAKVEIWGDTNIEIYNYTHSCTKHIYNLLSTGKKELYFIEERLTL